MSISIRPAELDEHVSHSYTYATLGEGIAWLVGWRLVLEYLFSCALVAIGWSGYLQSALHDLGLELPRALSASPFSVGRAHEFVSTGSIVNLPAVLIVALCTAVLLRGLRFSTGINSIIVVAKVAVIVVVTIAAFGHVDSANWSPFIPENTGHFGAYGWSGVFQGTAIVFFAYMGFDALAATGLMDYRQLNVPDPLYRALDAAAGALAWAKPLVGFVALFGLISVLFAALIGQSRIFYSMGRDGLLPASFARVHSSTGVPYVGTLVTAGIAMFAAGCLPLGLLSELISIGTLLAFGLVCAGVIVLRVVQPDVPRPFRVPWVPFIPICGALACAYLMWTLPPGTWLRLLIWLALGGLLYLAYGYRHSKLGAGK